MPEVEPDPVQAFAARRKRVAIVGALIVLAAIGTFVVVFASIANSMTGPENPLGHLELSTEESTLTFELEQPARVSLWIEVEQRRTTPLGSTSTPENGADVRVGFRGGEQRCETTDVVAFGVLERSGKSERWVGELSNCDLGRLEAGTHQIQASLVPTSEAIEVDRVVLTPSRDP